jgi:hypothetical protein
MKLNQSHLSILCFDGEDGDPAAAAAAKAAADAAAAAATGNSGDDKTFTQADLNKILAEDKRKHQEKMRKLEANLASLSEDRSLSEQQRESLSTELEDLRKSLRTKDQQAEYERKQAAEQHTIDLQAATDRADKWEAMYRQSAVDRALMDAAGDADAYRPSQIVNLLKPHTELKEIDGSLQPMINYPDIDEKTGEDIVTLRTPADAVKRMKEQPAIHGNLFNSGVVSGVGSGSGGGAPKPGEVDVANLTQEQYRKIRRENPEALGLPPNRMRKQ